VISVVHHWLSTAARPLMTRETIAADAAGLAMPPTMGLDVGGAAGDVAGAGGAATAPAPAAGGYWAPFGSREAAIRAAADALRGLLGSSSPDTVPLVQIAVGIGLAESELGVGPSWHLSSGAPSWNFGALVTSSAAQPSIDHGDTDASGKPITQRFAAFGSQAEGIKAFLNTWGDAAFAAASAGDVGAVASIMYDRHYYTGTKGTREERIGAYRSMVMGAAKVVAAALGQSLEAREGMILPAGGGGPTGTPVNASTSSSGSGSGTVAAVLVLGTIGLGLYATR
jgi:hypothetical protein